jgi:hypothetical protein
MVGNTQIERRIREGARIFSGNPVVLRPESGGALTI